MSEHSLYDGSVTLQFNQNARNRYMVGDYSPVGVTTVLSSVIAKNALMLWPLNEATNYLKQHIGQSLSQNLLDEAYAAHRTKSDKGKDTGTAIHAAIEAVLLEKEYDTPPEAMMGVDAFIEWMDTGDIRALATEQVVYSKSKRYAGTYDCMLEIEGHVILADIKTTNSSRTAPLGIYPEHFLQLGAYAYAHHEENPLETIEDLMVIRVGKDGVLNTLSASELDLGVHECEDLFLDTLKLYRYMTPISKKLAEMK